LPGGDVLAAIEIDGFDGDDFADIQRTDCSSHIGEVRAVGEKQGEITLDGGEARGGFVLARFLCGADRGVQRGKLQLGEEDFLAEL